MSKGLINSKHAAVKVALYTCALLVTMAIYSLLAYGLSTFAFSGRMTVIGSMLLAAVSALLFQPIKQFFDRIANTIFYGQGYESEVFFGQLGTLLSSTVDLRGLLERASTEIAATLKIDQVFFYIYYTNSTDHHLSAGTQNHTKMPLYDARALDAYVSGVKHKIIVVAMLADSDIKRMLQSHKIALVMPLRQGDVVAGYVMLGDRLSGSYTKRDLNVLATISNELVIAIQNAISLHEVRELNATLQQRIDVATKELRSSNAQLKHLDETKDEFISMASHQLRTPLTSIKGYISMVIEGDVGKISPHQHSLLQEAFNSSERMVRLINDFLNVSRLQTGRFVIDKGPVDIKTVVRQEIDSLQVMAAGHRIKLRLTITKAELPLVADESKLRQVIMNFVDNAIYYSHPDSTIVINLERAKDDMALTVVDTGIGVPVEEQAKLFTKFFRAKNARKVRPDGTGVGLYLARRVVSGHGGSIIFSSLEGKGSTFGFRLPLSKQLASYQKPTQALKKPIAK
jgi:signal transduction histidine kinase